MNSKPFLAAALAFAAAHNSIANPLIVPFVGDAQTRIRADRVYTHALDFGSKWDENLWVNGVKFRSTGMDGSDGAHSWGGFPGSQFEFQDNSPRISSPTDSGIYQVLGDFSHGLFDGTAWIDGLTPDVVYETRFYHRPFGDPANTAASRWQTFTFKPDANTADALLFNTDGQQEDQMLVYRYKAGDSGKLEIHFLASPLNPSDSYHCYGLVNEQVYEIAPGIATDLTAVSARLNAQAVVGGEASVVTAFWQPADAGDWAGAESAELASLVSADGAVYFDLVGLAPNTEYRFRFSLTNDAPRASWSDAKTFTTLPAAPVFSVAPAEVSGTNATLRGELLYYGPDAASATITLYWGADAGALGEAPLAQQNAQLGAFVFELSDLPFGATRYFRFMVENENNAQAWQDGVGSFTTLAAPVWGATAAASANMALELSAAFAAPGAAASDVTCWLGETPETMQPVASWAGSGAAEFAHTEGGLQPGGVYYYAFHALCEPDAFTSWSVWSATNQAQVAHVLPLLPALASGYYNVLLHLGANLADDSLTLTDRAADITTDKLAAFGGQAAQAPYPGLVYDGLPVIAGASPSLVWTVVTNNNNAADYGRWNINRDDYVKYLHIYVISPDSADRAARVYYTSDDRLHIWRNGEQILASTYTGGEGSAAFTLHPGVNSLAIKFIEEGGGDFFGFRITDSAGAPFDDLRYTFTASVLGPPAEPQMLALTHESALIDPNFAYAHSDEPFDLYIVCDTQDRGAALADWENSPTAEIKTFRGISAPPASVEFALAPATRYAARVFTVKAGFWERSLPLEFRAYNPGADIVSLQPTANAGTSIIANARLDYCGPGLSDADVYLFWWDDETSTTNSAILPAQPVGPVAIPINGLWYSQRYHCQFAASNALGFAWSPESVGFETFGVPIFGDATHAIPQPGELRMSAEVLSPGPEGGEVYCWFGAAPDALSCIGSEALAAPGSASFSRSGLVVGGTYYYAFQILSSAGSGAQAVSWDVWTATNQVVLSGSTAWTAAGGADTRWQNPANWSHGVPGAGANAVFPALTPASPYAVTADADIDIAAIDILAGDADTVTFDLGARALNVSGAFNIGYDRVRGRFLLASGEANVAGAFTAGHNASFCHATIATGARLNAQTLKAGWRSQNTDTTDDNTLVIEPGAEVVVSGETRVSHSEAGENSPNRSHLIVRGSLDANGIIIGSSSGWNGTSGFMTIDGGDVANRGSTTLGSWAGSNRAITLTNNARYIQTAGQLDLGIRGGNERLLVLDGSVFELAGNAYLMRGTDHSGNDAGIIVSNATFKATGALGIGRNGAGGGNDNLFLIHEDPGHETRVKFGGDINMNSTSSRNLIGLHGGVLDLAGHAFTTAAGGMADGNTPAGLNNRIHATRPTRVIAETLNIRTDTRLIFDLPEGAVYAAPIFDIAGAANFSADAAVEINLGKFTGTATLMESATGDLLPAHVVEITQAPGFNYKLTVEPNLLKIQASPSATLLLVR